MADGKHQQHEAVLRNGGIGQHALEVVLHDGRQVAQQQRRNAQHHHHHLPVGRQFQQAPNQQAQQHGKHAQLGRGRHEQSGRRGRTLVHIGHPHMKRHRSQFEGQPCHNKHQPQHQNRRLHRLIEGLHQHLRQIHGTRGAIHHRQAVKQKARGQSAEDEIFHARFGRQGVVTPQGHQGKTGQTRHFQAEINQQEMVARNHDVHPQQAEQRQREQLAAALQHVALRRIRARVHQCEQQGQGSHALEPTAQRIGQHHIAKAVGRLAGIGLPERHGILRLPQRQYQQGGLRQPVRQGAARAAHPQIRQRNHAGHCQQRHFRRDDCPARCVDHASPLISLEFWMWPRAAPAC